MPLFFYTFDLVSVYINQWSQDNYITHQKNKPPQCHFVSNQEEDDGCPCLSSFQLLIVDLRQVGNNFLQSVIRRSEMLKSQHT